MNNLSDKEKAEAKARHEAEKKAVLIKAAPKKETMFRGVRL